MNAQQDNFNLLTTSSNNASRLNERGLFSLATSTECGNNNNYLDESQALGNLFKSLSSLAHGQNSKQAFVQAHNTVQDVEPTNLSLNTDRFAIASPMSSQQQQIIQSSAINQSLADSIQNAVAAALMQRQFQDSISRHQQVTPPMATQSTLTNFNASIVTTTASTSAFLDEQLRRKFTPFNFGIWKGLLE